MTAQTDDIQKLWNRAKALDEAIHEYRSIDTERAWQQTWQRCQSGRQRGLSFYLLRIAGILILPLLISTITLAYLYINDNQRSQAVAYVEATSAPGIVTQITLPDSSKVWLNSRSTLRYPNRFVGDERNVTLQGEGYFEVQSDREHPFYVATKEGLRVMAHGTKFNVNAYADDEIIEATLEQGAVDILIGHQRETLAPGEQAIFDKKASTMHIQKAQVDVKTAWREGKLIFRNATMKEITKTLARRYNVDINLHDESHEPQRFRATFTNESLLQILDYLRMSAPISWSSTTVKQQADDTYSRQQYDVWIK
ncbi:MAG: FecR family protein [Parabacteroides sp.]